jgi:osmotically-inducible protein OsmY
LNKESQKALEDLALSSRVKAKLALDQATADCEFAISADGKTVELKGEIVSPEQLKKIGQIVRGMRGVNEVKTKQLKRVERI